MKDKKQNRLRCPRCNRLHILYQKRTNSFWCRQCGEEWTKGDKETKEGGKDGVDNASTR